MCISRINFLNPFSTPFGFSGGRTLTKILPLVLLFLPYPSSRALPNFSRPSPPASSSCQQQFGSDSSLFPLRWIWLRLLSLCFFFIYSEPLKAKIREVLFLAADPIQRLQSRRVQREERHLAWIFWKAFPAASSWIMEGITFASEDVPGRERSPGEQR